jgi:hypothetical protein
VWPARNRELDARLEIHLSRGIQIDLVNRDVATMLVENRKGVRCQQVIVDLFGRMAVFEDKRDRSFRGGRK